MKSYSEEILLIFCADAEFYGGLIVIVHGLGEHFLEFFNTLFAERVGGEVFSE